jgi:hypothetical protein
MQVAVIDYLLAKGRLKLANVCSVFYYYLFLAKMTPRPLTVQCFEKPRLGVFDLCKLNSRVFLKVA